MDPRLIYLFVFAVMLFGAVFLQKKYCFICDSTNAVKPKPYSYARLQLVWWTFIVLIAFIAIALTSGEIPSLSYSTLKLLGIGILTTATARLIDISDEANVNQANQANSTNPSSPTNPSNPADQTTQTTPINTTNTLSKDMASQGFFLDVLSDKNGISIHRLQAFIFNLVFGVWFIYRCVVNIKPINTDSTADAINAVMPVISDSNLILLGLSAGAYAALKSTENK